MLYGMLSVKKQLSDNEIKSIKSNLIKNAYQSFLINKVIKKYFNYKFSGNQNQLKDTSDVHYFNITIYWQHVTPY